METRHIMNAFQVFTYASIVTTLQAGYAVPAFFMSDDEWQQLAAYMPLQSENNMAYAAVLDAGYVEPGAHTHDSAEDDRTFEERHEGMINEGWMQL